MAAAWGGGCLCRLIVATVVAEGRGAGGEEGEGCR